MSVSNFRKRNFTQKPLINEFIKAKEVRLIDSNGEQLGVVSLEESLNIAKEQNLDVVCLSPTSSPPVCKVIDYGKYIYDQGKKKREAKKKQKNLIIKEIRLTPTIDKHDVQTKINNARKFILKGDKVKVLVRFRARAITHPEIGENLLLNFSNNLKDISFIEAKPRLEGYQMHILLIPKK